jgi:hypothetical protein
MNLRSSELLLIAFVVISSSCYPVETGQYSWKKVIVPGIEYLHIKKMNGSGPLHIHMVKTDLNNQRVNVKAQLANNIIGGLETTSSIAYRNNAIVAINGSFFDITRKTHLPVGLMIIDGEVLNRSILERTAIGITVNKEVIIGIPRIKGYVVNSSNRTNMPIWGLNRPRKRDEVIIYTNEYGWATNSNKFGKELVVDAKGRVIDIKEGNSHIPVNGFVVSLHGWSRAFATKAKKGDHIELRYDMEGRWKEVKQAVTGGPRLISNGVIINKESLESEKFNKNILEANSRTAVGITANNELLFVVVDKRYPISTGVTYDDLAVIMKELGAVDAMGLDGGHASTMYLNGKVVNYPLWGMEAAVSNAFTVTYDGWKVASTPKVPYTYIYVYEPPSEMLIEALSREAKMSPTAYVPRPEDYGMWGLYDIYRRVIKPVIPALTI